MNKETIHFLKEIQEFDYSLSGRDHLWKVLFKGNDEKWHYVHIVKYQDIFFISQIDGEIGTLEVNLSGSVKIVDSGFQSRSKPIDEDDMEAWKHLISSARKWLMVVKKDWIKASRQVQKEYPLNYRHGIVPGCIVKELLFDAYDLADELGKSKTKKIIRLIEDGIFSREEKILAHSMTAERYFEYCRIAYIAGAREEDKIDKSLSGREMYKKYADNRHEGLLDISPDSEQEFADWIDGSHPKKSGGGHPWEIKRGGNTTHIDLSVFRPPYREEGFIVQLHGESLGRMVETMRMILAIYDAGLPITMANPESVRSRLIGQDNIGIIPKYDNLHRANQYFHPKENVFDVVHYDDFGRSKRGIAPFISWEALPILKPNKL